YSTFDPVEAHRLTKMLEFHYTPKHASWLNMAEIEISALQQQCLDRRIPDAETLKREINAWQRDRNYRQVKVNWQFTTEKARVKLVRFYDL
ncbi:MAG: transposase, partial [Magnetococcales bacterium]|nr:transposase [Magnetococcales bacterium]